MYNSLKDLYCDLETLLERLSGADLDDDEFEEIEELIHEKKEHPEELVKTY
jgi:hypothetical protein